MTREYVALWADQDSNEFYIFYHYNKHQRDILRYDKYLNGVVVSTNDRWRVNKENVCYDLEYLTNYLRGENIIPLESQDDVNRYLMIRELMR